MLPQYVGGATVFGVVTNILTDTDELVLRHPAVKRMVMDTVQWGEETGRELFAKAVACIDAPSGCVRLRPTRVDPDAAAVAPATVDASPQAHRDSCSASVLDRIFTSSFGEAPPPVATVNASPLRNACSSSVLDRIFTSSFDDAPPPLELADMDMVVRDDVCNASTLERMFNSTPYDEPPPEPIVSVHDGAPSFVSNIAAFNDTHVLGHAARGIDTSWSDVVGPLPPLRDLAAGSGLVFMVLVLFMVMVRSVVAVALGRKVSHSSILIPLELSI